MKKKIFISILILGMLFLVAKRFFFMGGPPPGMMGEMPPPVVEVSQVKEIEIKDKMTKNGRVEAIDTVDIIASVKGYLQKVYFKEGSYVKKGDLLFLIEPDMHEIAVQQAKAAVEEANAALNEAEKNFVRVQQLVENDYASKAQFDNILAKNDRAKALLEVKKANLEQAKLNLRYTRIYAPISGKIGRVKINEGNFVSPSAGSLARIVSVDPIYVKFSLKSDDYLKLVRNNDLSDKREVEIKFSDDSVYPAKGEIHFYDNQINPSTGTIAVRAIVKNPDSVLIPGQYVCIISYSNKTRKELVIEQEAVLDNPKGKYVYILQEDKTVKMQPIKVGKQHEGFWLVTEGLKLNDKVVSKGVQKLRPNAKVMLTSEMPAMPGQKPPVKGNIDKKVKENAK